MYLKKGDSSIPCGGDLKYRAEGEKEPDAMCHVMLYRAPSSQARSYTSRAETGTKRTMVRVLLSPVWKGLVGDQDL